MWPFSSRPEVGCLGKLPCAADFSVQQPLGVPAEETLSPWLHAIAGGGGQSASSPGSSPGFDFLAMEPGGRGGIAGRLWPSADSAGRSFPFALYKSFHRRDLKPDLAALLPRLPPLWGALDGLVEAGGRSWIDGGADIGAVRAAIRGAKVSLPEPDGARAYAKGLRDREPWPILAAIFAGKGAAEIAAALIRFGRFIENLAAEQPAVALRVPMSPAMSASEQSLFWAAWMEARLGRPVPLPRLFVQERWLRGRLAEAAKGIWFIYRAPLAQDAEVLFHGRATHEYLCDLAQGGSEPAADDGAFAERLRSFRTCGELFAVPIRPDLVTGWTR